MRPSSLAVFALALAITGVAVGRQLAMLVELEPVETVDGGVLTEIVVLVAPEDRAALGEDVMLWVELSREEVRILRRGWALKIDDPAEPLRVEIVVPDGPHVLRVDLEGASGRSTGVWWGDVDLAAPSPVPEPVPVPVSVPVTATPSVPETAPETVTVSEPATVTGTETGGTGTEAGVAAAAAAADTTDGAPETAGGALRPRDPDADGGRAVNDPPTDVGAAETETETEAESVPVPVPVPDDSVRGSASASGSESPAHDPTPEAAAVSIPNPIPQADLTEPGPPYGAITMMVTRDHQPVTDLVAENFEVKIGGKPVAIDHLSGPGEGTSILGVAVDLHAVSSAESGWIAGMVRALAERAAAAPGRVFVNNVNGRLHLWLRPDEVASKIEPVEVSSADELPALVLSSLGRCQSEDGKAFLLLVTDGRGPRAGKSWGEAHRAAAAAGVPVIIAGIWNEDFGSGLRKDLRKLASVSGGSVFYVQGPSQSGNLIERFGAVIEAGYSAGVTVNPGTQEVEVSLVGVDADLRSALAVRRGTKPWILPEDGRMRGNFVYMADAAIFTECATGTRLPVAMEADYISAERAYLDDRSEPGSPLLMTIDARVDLRPGMEGDLLHDAIIIDRFHTAHPGEGCE